MSRTQEENRKPEEAGALPGRPGRTLSAEDKRRVMEELYRALTS